MLHGSAAPSARISPRLRLAIGRANLRIMKVSEKIDRVVDRGEPAEDGELVGRTLRGEVQAFEVLVARYQREATAAAYRLLNNRDDAMDTVQDAFLKAYEKLDSLSRPELFGGWFMRIVSNISLNRRRARALRITAPLEGASDDGESHRRFERGDPHAAAPPGQASAKELKEQIASAIEELPEIQRRALLLFSVSGTPQREVAELLGVSVEAVKWYVFTARKTLKDKLKDSL